MKFVYLIIFILSAIPSFGVEYACNNQCTVVLDPKTQKPTDDLNCTIPNMPNMSIKAENVFDANGNLKTHWNSHSVCDVL